MRILAWLTAMFKAPDKKISPFSPRGVPPSSVGADERVFCFADGRKTTFSPPGVLPQIFRAGEKCVILPVQPVSVSVDRDGSRYVLDIVAEPDDALAALLERHPHFDGDALATLCENALAAALPALAATVSPERLRAQVSVELLLSGFRCAGLSSVRLPPPPADGAAEGPEAGPPEPEGSADELAAELGAVSKMAGEFGITLDKTAMPAGGAMPERERIAARLRAMAADLSAKLREYREDLADSRAIEARLGLPAGEGAAAGGPEKEVAHLPADVEVPDPKRPFTLLVWRRTDIDRKLRRYVDETLSGSASAARKYRREALGRNFKLGGRADLLAASLDNCRAELASWPLPRHGFSYTQPDGTEIRRRIKAIKAAADAAAGARNAVAVLCSQPPEETAIASALGESEAAVAVLAGALRGGRSLGADAK